MENEYDELMRAKKSGWDDAVKYIQAELEKEFGHEPSQRLMAIMDGNKWQRFWSRFK